ncbi:uncharacterized protein LOC131157977 [Malania oleifera]|uniref:uncharacterized protein LOC131157977 n=1 Tax=Malania oleifera TaxID=397392 RepID=UPI0025ADD1EC|nr:uncharacterized protein LOC131157977 [Malania oleifera]
MASVALHLKRKGRTTPGLNPGFVHPKQPSFVHVFSSSSSDSNDDDIPTSQSSFPFSSYFSDVKATLKKQPQQHQNPSQAPPRKPLSFSPPKTPLRSVALEEIRNNLSHFRHRSVPPAPDNTVAASQASSSSPQISFQEMYKRNVAGKSDVTGPADKGGRLSFEAVMESVRQLRSTSVAVGADKSKGTDPMSLSAFKDSLKLRPVYQQSRVIGGGPDKLPASVFGKELKEKEAGADGTSRRTEFVRPYSLEELGMKLRKLRPEAKGENWFSLGELNDRVMRLMEIEDKEAQSSFGGVHYKELRESLLKLRMSDNENVKKSNIQRLDVLGQLGGTPDFMLAPPKEHLVEKYFHPDNMSSAEKMKLELHKVRDEFKMSESDCGSTRVQVAQLTTKIKYLSSTLHKKDKHSRKGLLAMVQRRKRLLKYLRRTDWDSYCLVLSKLGLRDTPVLKA